MFIKGRKIAEMPNIESLRKCNDQILLFFEPPSVVDRVVGKSLWLINKRFWATFWMCKGYIIDSKQVVFFRNSKAGGTSIVYALANSYPEMRVLNFAKMLFDNSWNYTKFCVRRNPEERLNSAYKWVNKTDQRYKFKSYSDFFRYVEKNPYKNQHWMPQDCFVRNSNVVLNFETLEHDFELFCKKYGLEVKFPLQKLKG